MSPLEWIATVLGVACVTLGVVRSVWTFPTGIASVALVALVVVRERLYSDALLQLFFVFANIYGWVGWSRSRADAGEVVVERLSVGGRWRWLLGCVAGTVLWAWPMRAFTDAAYPFWDGGIAIVSVAAQLLMARRAWENWLLWIAVDLASVPLYLLKHLDALAGLYMVYLGLAVWGLVDWLRVRRAAA